MVFSKKEYVHSREEDEYVLFFLHECYDETGVLSYWQQSEVQYNEQGDLLAIQLVEYVNNELSQRIEAAYEYDANGNLIKDICSWYEGNELLDTEEYTYEYDDKGNMVREKYSYTDKSGEVLDEYNSVFEYDDKGILVSGTDTVSQLRGEYVCDSEGNILKENYYYASGAKSMTIEYDAKGNEIKSKEYTSDGKLNRLVEREYDEYSNETLVKEYISEDGLDESNPGEPYAIEARKYKYNESGDITEMEYAYSSVGDVEYIRITYEYVDKF